MSAFAFAAGGNATQLVEGVWSGWNSGPAVAVGDGGPLAGTVWPASGGTAQMTNAATRPGVGIFAKGHTITGTPIRHASLRLVPRNQGLWRERRPKDFVNQDDHNNFFATIGAGPLSPGCSGTLVSDVNRPNDVDKSRNSLELLQYPPIIEDSIIERLLQLDANYPDDLTYECYPDSGTTEYNSNSYVSGLLKASDVPDPSFPYWQWWLYPGWTKPVPEAKFAPKP